MSADDQTLALIGGAKSPIKVACNEYEGRRTLDIRRHYFDKSSRDLKPTTKGISVGRDAFKELMGVLEKNTEVIEAWLDDKENFDSGSIVRRNDNANKLARLNAKLAAVPVDLVAESWKGAAFFSCKSEGGKDVVILNDNHPLINAVREVEAGQRKVEDLLAAVVISYFKARNVFQGCEEPFHPDDVFDLIEFNWGLYLSNILKLNQEHVRP